MSIRALCGIVLVIGLWARVALAQPSAATSTVPPTFRVVPATPGAPDPSATFTVIVRDAAAVPLAGEPVFLDFSSSPYVQPSSVQPFPGVGVEDCDPPTLVAYTNAAGEAAFNVRGAILHRSIVPGPVVTVSAGAPPVVLGTSAPSAFDQDGVNGLNGNDLSLFLCDFANPDARTDPRSDYDGSGAIGAGDFSPWLAHYAFTRGREQSASRCDGGATSTPRTTAPRGGIFLRWTNCRADGGPQTRVSTCLSNTGTNTLVASFVAPAGVDAMTGLEAEIQVLGAAGAALPDWWNLQGGGCRATSTSVNFAPVGSAGCPDANDIPWTGGPVIEYPNLNGAPDRLFIRVIGAVAPPGVALTAGQEYRLFSLNINNSKTVGAGLCAGCGVPVAILFDRLELNQPADAAANCSSPALTAESRSAVDAVPGDFELLPDMGGDAFVAYWQGVPPGFAVTDVPRPGAGARFAIDSPNPGRGPLQVALTLPVASSCRLALYDVAGRQRRVVHEGVLDAGTHPMSWDGRDDRGEPLRSGYYVWRATMENRTLSQIQILLR